MVASFQPDFAAIVDANYKGLYRFALTLSKNATEAADLTQQTFYLWAAKGHQLKEAEKAKAWLFTTIYREFVKTYRRQRRFPQVELESAPEPVVNLEPMELEAFDGATVLAALIEIEEVYRVPVSLFYLEELSYKAIAELLQIPIGTVMSRLSRGKAQLRAILNRPIGSKVIPMPTEGVA